MSWRAVFVDGPLEGKENDRLFMGAWQSELYFAPIPSPWDWILVGTDSLDPGDDWPGQIRYVRDDERSSLIEAAPGEDEGFAIFRLADG